MTAAIPPDRIGRLHQLAAPADQPHRVGECQDAHRDERAELAERMAGGDDRALGDPGLARGTERGDRGRGGAPAAR